MADRTKTSWNSDGKVVNAETVTPHDTEKRYYDALFVGNVDGDPTSVGNLVIRPRDASSDVTLYNVLAGTWLPISVIYVRSTNTTCTNIIGFDCQE